MMNCNFMRLYFFVLIVLFFALAQDGNADDETDLKQFGAESPYCGINSLFACLSSLGIEVEPNRFVDKQFVGSWQGSTSSELVEAAKSVNAIARPFSHLTRSSLLSSINPMILHFRGSGSSSRYHHWVAFLGFEDGKARIIDHPKNLELIPIAELLAKWDGNAIVVSRNGGSVWFQFWHFVEVFSLIAITSSLLIVSAKIVDFFSLEKSVLGQIVFVNFVAFIAACFFHATSPEGFFKNSFAIAEVERRYSSVSIEEVSLVSLRKEIADKDVVLLDSRQNEDFLKGSIPGAKSLPISSSITERKKILAEVGRNERIVVFCQSSRCHYAHEIANFLRFNGYDNLAVYSGGYVEWLAMQ